MEITQSENRVTIKCPASQVEEAWAWMKQNNYRVCTMLRESGKVTITAVKKP